MYLPLDSILSYAWMRKNHPELLTISTSGDRLIDIDLSDVLERREENGEFFYACSFAIGEVKGEEIQYWHKRADQSDAEKYVDFGKRKGKIDTKQGAYKSYRNPIVIKLIPKITWYVKGDKTKIEELLNYITHIGKKRSQGYGRVSRWQILETEEDLSHLRAIPDKNGLYYTGVRPPYWLDTNIMQASIPDDERLLCKVM